MTQRRLKNLMRQHNSLLLMSLLLLSILSSPITDIDPHAGIALTAAFVCSLFVGASYWENRRIILRIGIPLAVLWMIARLLEELGVDGHAYDRVAHFLGFTLSGAVLWAVFDRLGKRTRTSGDVIAEAFIGYLMIAIAFSQIYWILNRLIPDCFANPGVVAQSSTFLYFSLTTLTGVGSGDILPINPFVRLVSTLETVSGIFFIAVVVARMVSTYERLPVAAGKSSQ